MVNKMAADNHNSTPTTLGDLPPELVQQIPQTLDTQSLLRLARTCHSLYWLLAPQIKHHAHTKAFAPLPLYEENFIYDHGQRHGIDDPVFSLHASYGVPAGNFGPTDADVLGKAVAGGELDTVRGFLRHDLDPNSYIVSGERMLGLAVQSRRIEMVQLLVEFGADPCRPDLVTGITPLVHAARCGKEEIVRLLIEVGGDLNADRVMQLIVRYCSAGTVRMAMEYGGNLACISSSGMTVLHGIVARKDVSLFDLVKDELSAVVLNARDDVGRTALHLALVDGDSPLAIPLASHPGVDIDIQDIWGYTALHLAIQNSRLDVAHVLIQRGANLNMLTLHGENSLHLAVESGSVSIASTLFEQGADRDGDRNMTEFVSTYFWASHSGNPEMMDLFRQVFSEDSPESKVDEMDDAYMG